MRRREFVLALPLLGSLHAFADDKAPYSGIWELNVPYRGSQGRSKIVMMKQVGDSLTLKDLETGQEYAGQVNPAGITFPLNVKARDSQESVTASFAGTMTQGSLKGNTSVDGANYEWAASKLTSVWLCANHNPIHMAKSREQMSEFTRENKCEGWHRARPEAFP